MSTKWAPNFLEGRREASAQPDTCEFGAEGHIQGQAGAQSCFLSSLPATGLCSLGEIGEVLVCPQTHAIPRLLGSLSPPPSLQASG